LFVLFCLIRWDLTNKKAFGGALGTSRKLLAKKGAWTLFLGIWTNGVKVQLNFKVFMDSEIEINYLLIWKNHNLHNTCPNAKKQSPCTPTCKNLSIRANFVVFGSKMWKLWIFLLRIWIKLPIIFERNITFTLEVQIPQNKAFQFFSAQSFFFIQDCNLLHYIVKVLESKSWIKVSLKSKS